MARSTAHELNQPLTILSGNLQMLIKHKENPEKSEQYLAKIEEASVRLTETIRKIQTIQQDDLQNYLGNTNLTEANPATNIIYCGIKKELFAFIDHFFSTQTQSIIYWAKNEADIRKILEKNVIHFIFMEYNLPSFNTIEFINHLKARQISVPIFILSDRKNDKIAAKVLAAGAQDFLPRAKITENRLHLLYNQFHRFN
jgi:two-component system cell cycle response regulator